MTHPERLNALARINAARSYLEIGVNKGGTFLCIETPRRVAFDPNFLFDTQSHKSEATSFYEVTSDVYFSEIASPQDQFDLIFLDGLHTFEQTFRDFCASLSHSHQKTIWVIDDTNPVSWAAAARKQRQLSARVVRRLLRDRRLHWMGDVFKVVFAIHDFFPQFSYATFCEHGQTVVRHQTREQFLPSWDSLAKITRLNYWDFLDARDSHLNIMQEGELLTCVATALRQLSDVGADAREPDSCARSSRCNTDPK